MASAGSAVDADADGKPRGAGSPGSCENNENGNSLATSSTSFGMDGWSDDGSFEPPPRLLLDKFSDFVAAQPDKVLFRFLTSRGTECDRLTYADVDSRSRALATHIRGNTRRGLGLAPGSVVMLVYPPSLDFIVAYLACLRAQVVAVPAYPPDPSKLKKNVRMFASIQASCGATVALTSEKYNMLTNVASMKERVKSLFSFGGKSSAVEWPEMKWVTTDTLTTTPCPASNEADLDQATEGDIAFLQYTSGSTATPKGVMVSHGNLAHNLNAITRSLHAKDKTVVVSWLPQYHDMGLIGSFLGVVYCGGSGAYMSPLSFIKNPAIWIKAVSQYGGTHLQAPSFAYGLTARKFAAQQRFKLQDMDLSSVQHIFNAAEPIEQESIRQFLSYFAPTGLSPKAMSPGYGLAEHTVFVCDKGRQVLRVAKATLAQNRVEVKQSSTVRELVAAKGGESQEASGDCVTLVGCGFPRRAHDVEVIIVDPETLAVLGDDHVGEIWINSPSKACGYWGKPELTAATFHAVPAPSKDAGAGAGAGAGGGAEGDDASAPLTATGRGGYLRSGDLGFMHEGELFVCGRHKDLIIVRGRNHYPHDIEATVQSDGRVRPGCISAFCVGKPGQESVVVLAELRDGKTPSEDAQAIALQLRVNVRREHGVTPSAVVLLPPRTVPKTTSGKIARQWGKKAFESGSLRDVAVFELVAPDAVDNGDWGHDAPAVDVRSWGDDQLRQELVKAVATLAGIPAADVNCSEPLSTHMDSLVLFQMHQELSSKYGLYMSDDDMYADNSSINYIIANRLRLGVPKDVGTAAVANTSAGTTPKAASPAPSPAPAPAPAASPAAPAPDRARATPQASPTPAAATSTSRVPPQKTSLSSSVSPAAEAQLGDTAPGLKAASGGSPAVAAPTRSGDGTAAVGGWGWMWPTVALAVVITAVVVWRRRR